MFIKTLLPGVWQVVVVHKIAVVLVVLTTASAVVVPVQYRKLHAPSTPQATQNSPQAAGGSSSGKQISQTVGTKDTTSSENKPASSAVSGQTGSQNAKTQTTTKTSSSSGGGSTSTSTSTSQTGGSSGGNSGGSSGGVTTPTNTPPTAPTNASAAIVDYNRVTIRATRATDSDGIARHELLRGSTVVATTTSTSDPVTLADTSVTVGATYTYYMRAVDTQGAVGPSSNGVTVTIPPQDLTPPSTPTNFRLIANVPGSITLAWDPSTDNKTTQANMWYVITSPLDESNLYTWTTDNPYTTSWFDIPGVTHDIYIQAIDEASNISAKAGPLTFTAQ